MASALTAALPPSLPHFNNARRSPPRLRSQTYSHRRSPSPIDLNTNSSRFAQILLLPVSATSSSPRHRLHAQSQEDYSPSPSSFSSGDPGAAEAFSWLAVVFPFLFPALGGLLFGYDIGATSGAAVSLQSAELSGTNWFNLSAVQLGLVKLGRRRREIIVAAFLYIIGGLTTGYASNLSILILGRLLYGIGIGLVSFGPISWLMVSEIFPLKTRGRGISLAVLVNFGSNALVTFAFSPLKELLGPDNLFLLFGVIALVSLVFILLKVPETKGLSLEEIESNILK